MNQSAQCSRLMFYDIPHFFRAHCPLWESFFPAEGLPCSIRKKTLGGGGGGGREGGGGGGGRGEDNSC